jgi:hypothetical protein
MGRRPRLHLSFSIISKIHFGLCNSRVDFNLVVNPVLILIQAVPLYLGFIILTIEHSNIYSLYCRGIGIGDTDLREHKTIS